MYASVYGAAMEECAHVEGSIALSMGNNTQTTWREVEHSWSICV